MKSLYLRNGPFPDGFFDGAVRRILELQRADGAIPWYDGGVIDPWNHTEAAMGLATAGARAAAERAYSYLAATQLPDGSWWGNYGAAVPINDARYEGDGNEKRIRDTNFCAYPATGIWHHYLITGDKRFLAEHFPMIDRAIGWVLSWQSSHGEIRWAADDPGTPEDDALVTGSSSVYKSLECAIRIADALGLDRREWVLARARLGTCLRSMPHRFDRSWAPKSNFSMDWYYPVLAGVVAGDLARARLAKRWEEFVVAGAGCRCVLGADWVTIAESCELAIALLKAGRRSDAQELLAWQHQWRDDSGAYWMGYQFTEEVPWPTERPAWTAAAILLAADALTGATPAARLFLESIPEPEILSAARSRQTPKQP